MKKIVLLAFVLVLLSTAVAVRFVRPVEASGTIYIRADGSVEGTTDISSDDNITYTFTANIFNQSIVIERDNIVIDGVGYTVQGTGSGTGIDLSYRNNVTLKNAKVTNFYRGIYLDSSSNNTLIGNNVSSNYNYGIYLDSSSNNSLVGNNASSDGSYGIFLDYSDNNTLIGNTASNNIVDGIYLRYSSSNVLTGNTVSNNEMSGIHLWDSGNNLLFHNSFINNTWQFSPYLGDSVNIWDDGYPSGGNYWSDYEERYPNATELDESGIWDTPYVIDENNIDNYPLVPEFPTWTSILLILIVLTVSIVVYKRRLLRKPIY